MSSSDQLEMERLQAELTAVRRQWHNDRSLIDILKLERQRLTDVALYAELLLSALDWPHSPREQARECGELGRAIQHWQNYRGAAKAATDYPD